MLRNETKQDVEFNLKASDNMAGKKARLGFLIAALIFLVIGGVCLTLDLLYPSEEGDDLFFSILMLVLAAVFFVMTFAFGAINKKTLLKMSEGKETVNRYSFTEDGYEIYSEANDGTVSTVKGGYHGLTQVREFADMWLLYFNKATVFAVSKTCMTEGTAEELSAFLRRVVGVRYKVCYKVK